MDLRLFTLGGLRLEAAGQRAAGPPAQRRRLALLALLAAAGERGVSREKAFGYLWPEHSTTRARHQLSESLYVLRRFLSDAAIIATADEMWLDETRIWSDVRAFRAALATDDDAAVALYQGRFLDGFFLAGAPDFDQWALHERESLERDYLRLLERIADRQLASGDTAAAAAWWERIVVGDPYSSRAALRYMQALAASGERVRAIQHAALHSARLHDDMGLAADREVLELAHELQRAAPAAASQPATFPDFEVVRPIGAGSVAQVFLAREPALKRLVAIKVLLPQLVEVETARVRFEREAQAAARIQHPHVLTAFRFGRTRQGAPFIVMPYVAGGTLEDRLAATGPLPLDEGKRAIAQIASALAAAHRLGIVHRDVRPANVLFDRATDRLLLSDFGLAGVLDDAGVAAARITAPGEMLGHAAYASPEQIRGEPVTERADVYSLGVLAFEVLTGRLPFDATPSSALGAARERVEPRRLRRLLPDADEATEALLGRCLNRRPEQRPFAAEISNLR